MLEAHSSSTRPQITLLHQARVRRAYDSLAGWMANTSWYRDQRVLGEISKCIPSEAVSIADICCGMGITLSALAKYRAWRRVNGVDIADAMVGLARAEARKNGVGIVEVDRGDWVEPLANHEPFDVILVKNALHLLDDPARRLADLSRICHCNTVLVIVETVSPSATANKFVRELFKITDFDRVKRHYFTRDELFRAVSDSGWALRTHRSEIDQFISVTEWLDHKCPSTAARLDAEDFLRNASHNTQRSMRFDCDRGSVPTHMLRLQVVAAFRRQAPRRLLNQLTLPSFPVI